MYIVRPTLSKSGSMGSTSGSSHFSNLFISYGFAISIAMSHAHHLIPKFISLWKEGNYEMKSRMKSKSAQDIHPSAMSVSNNFLITIYFSTLAGRMH